MQDDAPTFQFRKVFTLSSGHFVHDVFSSFLAPFLPLLIHKFGWSMLMAGSLTVFFRIPSLFSPAIGSLSDRVDMRYWAVAALAVTAVCMSLLGTAPGYIVICGLMLTAGVSASVFHVVAPVIIARASGNMLGKGMSFWMTGGELARTVGPVIAVWSVSLLGFEHTYPVMAGGLLFSVLFYVSLKNAPPGLSQSAPGGSTLKTWNSLRHVFLPLSGIMLSRAFMVAAFSAFLPTYMVNAGRSLWIGGISLTILELAGTLGTFLGGTFSDRMGRKTVLLRIFPISSFSMLAFIYVSTRSSDAVIFVSLVVLGCSLFAISPISMAVVHDFCGKQRGTANGLYMGINFLTTAAVTFLIGWLSDQYGMSRAFTISALMGLSGIPFIFSLPEKADKTP